MPKSTNTATYYYYNSRKMADNMPENEECGHVVVKVSHYYNLCSYIFKSIIVNSVLG